MSRFKVGEEITVSIEDCDYIGSVIRREEKTNRYFIALANPHRVVCIKPNLIKKTASSLPDDNPNRVFRKGKFRDE